MVCECGFCRGAYRRHAPLALKSSSRCPLSPALILKDLSEKLCTLSCTAETIIALKLGAQKVVHREGHDLQEVFFGLGRRRLVALPVRKNSYRHTWLRNRPRAGLTAIPS